MSEMSLEAINAELELERIKLKNIFAKIASLESLKEKMCEHKRTEYWHDASGNNDSGTQCLDCGVWL